MDPDIVERARNGDREAYEQLATSAAHRLYPDAFPVVTIWTSADLEEWAQVEFPRPYLDALAATDLGLIAASADDCFYTGGDCPPDDLLFETFLYLSADGTDWSEIEPIGNASLRPSAITDGPAGPIAIGSQGGPTSDVWQIAAP